MSLSIFLFCLVSIPLSINATPAPTGFFIDCGASSETKDESIKWITDDGFINVGNKTTLDTPDLLPILSTLRFFPDNTARKYCYLFPVTKRGKYLIRTMYYYGGFDGGKAPPVFDQIIDGTKWSSVNTADNYAKGLTSFYEIVVGAMGKTLSVCLARNEKTESSPFISALEVVSLEDSMYNATDFSKYALSTVARHNFGEDEKIVSFPEDPLDRNWSPFTDATILVVDSHSNITSDDFWNHPPVAVFSKAFIASRGKQLQLNWPPASLPEGSYHVVLYFQDNRTPSAYSWRIFNVLINGNNFYKRLNVSAAGVSVYSANWPLSGQTKITLLPEEGSPVGPVINAGEVFQIVKMGGRTLTRDVIAMEDLARSLDNPPSDWKGDPCLPKQNSWTGVTCSDSRFARIVTLNLTNFGISGSIPSSIANLTGITDILLGGNKLTGSIPDLSPLKQLAFLHLNDNQLTGKIPKTLSNLDNIKEIFLQNNHLEGGVPNSLKNRKNVNIQSAIIDNESIGDTKTENDGVPYKPPDCYPSNVDDCGCLSLCSKIGSCRHYEFVPVKCLQERFNYVYSTPFWKRAMLPPLFAPSVLAIEFWVNTIGTFYIS